MAMQTFFLVNAFCTCKHSGLRTVTAVDVEEKGGGNRLLTEQLGAAKPERT